MTEPDAPAPNRLGRSAMITLIVAGIAALIAGWVAHELIERQVRDEITDQAELGAETVRSISQPMLVSIAGLMPVLAAEADPPALEFELRTLVQEFPLMRSVAIVDTTTGEVVATSGGMPPYSMEHFDIRAAQHQVLSGAFTLEGPNGGDLLVFGGAFPIPGNTSRILVGEMTVNDEWLSLLSNDAGTDIAFRYYFRNPAGEQIELFATDRERRTPVAREPISFGGNGNDLIVEASATPHTVTTLERLAPLLVGTIAALLGLVVAGVLEWARRRRAEYERVRQEASRLDQALARQLRVEEELEHRAFHDPLTGLPNRAWFVERADLEANPRPTTIFFVDLDGFKVVNDSLGHDAGDQLLVTIARRLEDAIDAGSLVIRFGGDEFIVLSTTSVDPAAIDRQADAIRAAVSPAMTAEGETVFVTASVGVRVIDDGEASADTLLRDADAAMYAAKDLGRDRHVVFDGDLRDQAVERLQLDSDLRHALNEEELRLEYQPVVSLRSGQVIGAEALLRWEHPDRGLLLPDQFLPMFADTTLLTEVDDWVLDRASAQLAAWHQEGMDVSVAVNLSGVSLTRPDLVDFVGRYIERSVLRPGSLVLELTERRLVRRVDGYRLEALHAAGAGISIDDFGTGYSALSYLRDLPVDYVKLDKSFVAPLTSDDRTLAIVRSILVLTNELGVTSIAEGVETDAQASLLADLGCDAVQGTLISASVDPGRVFEHSLV